MMQQFKLVLLCAAVGFFIMASAADRDNRDDAESRLAENLAEMHNMLNEFKEIATKIEEAERKYPPVSSNIQTAAVEQATDCITQFDIDAQTGNAYGASQYKYYGSNPRFGIELISGENCLAEIVGNKNEGQRFQRKINVNDFKYCSRSNCISPSTIKNVYLKAVSGGTDGWFVESIETYYTAKNGKRVKLSSDPYLQKWIDYNEEYKYDYDAKHVPLTIVGKCLTELLIEAQTGTLRGSGFSSYYMGGKLHKIELCLTDNSNLEGKLHSPVYNGRKYSSHFDFSSDLNAGSKCVKKSDIQMVKLVAGGGDGWYVTSITTRVKTASSSYEVLTEDNPFNLWLDSDEPWLYDYDATKHVLNLGNEDRPVCDHGSPTCICKQTASTCIFNFEIDEIQTFTSYKKLKHDQNDPFSMYIRGTQGVSYFINNDTGGEESHKAYTSRACSKENFDPSVCTDPQYVDGKTFREAIGVNGQIPGPTIIVHDQQMVVIHVRNNLTLQGISIHWHGMHQRGTPWMDGVGQVSHCQIGPASTFSYIYKASPTGTFWYHSHSGTQRTDGFYGALIVKEKPDDFQRVTNKLGLGTFEDIPENHTISILDFEEQSSYERLLSGLGYYEETNLGQVPDNSHERYESTRSFEKAEVGPVPFYSGLLNGKGRHNDIPYIKTRLSVFQVEPGKKYRFRLIGAQGLYATKFSIDGHKLTVVATDGYWIKPVKDVDYIIIHTGERFDFILNALNDPAKSFWMRAETLEIKHKGAKQPPYESLGHVAEGILQYSKLEIHSRQYESIKQESPPIVCNSASPCKAVNCPFKDFHRSYHIKCLNIAEMRLLEPTPNTELPDAYPCKSKNCQHFINFNFEGDSQSSAINGRNFVLPSAPPQTQYKDFSQQVTKCSLDTICNPQSTSCLCTHVLDLPNDETVQLVLSAVGEYDNAHPIHVHGHTFHVVKVGYPEYDDSTGFIKRKSDHSIHNSDIKCGDKDRCRDDKSCNEYQCTQPSWNGNGPTLSIDQYTIRKDTVMLPAGGYVVINFRSDNPGFWFLHCHIEVHQLEGMAVILNEGNTDEMKPPEGMNTCGNFELTVGQYERITQDFEAAMNTASTANQQLNAARNISLGNMK